MQETDKNLHAKIKLMNQFDADKFKRAMGLKNTGDDAPEWMGSDTGEIPDRKAVLAGAMSAIELDPIERQERLKKLVNEEAITLMQKFFCQRMSEGNTKTIEKASIALQNTPIDRLTKLVDTLYIPPESITDEMINYFSQATQYQPSSEMVSHMNEVVATYFRANDLNTAITTRNAAKADSRDTATRTELDWIREFKINDNLPDETIINHLTIKPRST